MNIQELKAICEAATASPEWEALDALYDADCTEPSEKAILKYLKQFTPPYVLKLLAVVEAAKNVATQYKNVRAAEGYPSSDSVSTRAFDEALAALEDKS